MGALGTIGHHARQLLRLLDHMATRSRDFTTFMIDHMMHSDRITRQEGLHSLQHEQTHQQEDNQVTALHNDAHTQAIAAHQQAHSQAMAEHHPARNALHNHGG
jgi:hypothetical protein